ncbi:MAG: flagellar biosynthetic protein FliR [Pirellulaceae bacterium]|nr:flagellar biosynthetic protein FliR [Pirellulaceae bacterium]
MLGESLVAIVGQPLWVFVSILARIGPVLMLSPPVNSSGLPMRLRALLVISVAALLMPIASAAATPMPGDILHWVIALVGELMLGVLLGSVIMLAIVALQVAGHAIGNLSGMDIAVSIDPSTQEDLPVLSNLLSLLAIATLLLLGGHRMLMQCAMESFAQYPAGGVSFQEHWLPELQIMLGHSFVVGLRAAAPLAIALLLSNIVTGLLARTLPQLNILSIGFNLNISALMIVLFVSLGSMSWVFQSELATWIDSCQRAIAVR